MASNLARLRQLVSGFGTLLDGSPSEADVLREGAELLRKLVSIDDWLPPEFALADAERYRQYLLHADSQGRFSVVSFVWGPGQRTPIHDHTVWGLIGVLRGAEVSQPFERAADGSLEEAGHAHRIEPGDVEAVSPSIGDLHLVSNAFDDRDSVSIHVYGANIGGVVRSTYDRTGQAKPFISGYANTHLPNIWNVSTDSPASV